jgi:hypothetical protein
MLSHLAARGARGGGSSWRLAGPAGQGRCTVISIVKGGASSALLLALLMLTSGCPKQPATPAASTSGSAARGGQPGSDTTSADRSPASTKRTLTPIRISVEEARRASVSGEALLVCAYALEVKCERARLEGALTLQELRERQASLPDEMPLLFYCD